MKKNLNAADHIVKLVLSSLMIIFYFTGIISGPFARILMILSFIVLLFFALRLIFGKHFID
ncbi:MAG TPA: hypothetical protein VFW11_04365 [Cyclobacteriaceae bacterium]|nr:hypothetical protein [Cyclobacteriaceae bacterium]